MQRDAHLNLNAFGADVHANLQLHVLDHGGVDFEPALLQRGEPVRRHSNAARVLLCPSLLRIRGEKGWVWGKQRGYDGRVGYESRRWESECVHRVCARGPSYIFLGL
jgi:hypothetical protein